MVELPYGRVPYPLDLLGHSALILRAPEPPPRPDLAALLDAALDAPIGRPRVERMVSSGTKVTVIVSDDTRSEPRAAFLEHLRARLPAVSWTLAVATGTHGPSSLDALALPAHFLRDARIVNHDGHDEASLVALGTTSRGTPVRLHRCLLDADLVIASGCIRPHYFAGFGAGTKAIFPGLGGASAIRRNHELKTHPSARAGVAIGNACRDDLEEAAGLLPTPTFLLDGVCAPERDRSRSRRTAVRSASNANARPDATVLASDLRTHADASDPDTHADADAAGDSIHAVVAGDPIAAFRVGAELARPWFTVRAPRASLVIASDALPVTASLYQAAKIAAAVAPLVADGGTLLLVAECADGIGPLDIVNEAIFRIGVFPRLAPGVAITLVSSRSRDEINRTLVNHAPSVDSVLQRASGPIVVVPHASRLIIEPLS